MTAGISTADTPPALTGRGAWTTAKSSSMAAMKRLAMMYRWGMTWGPQKQEHHDGLDARRDEAQARRGNRAEVAHPGHRALPPPAGGPRLPRDHSGPTGGERALGSQRRTAGRGLCLADAALRRDLPPVLEGA